VLVRLVHSRYGTPSLPAHLPKPMKLAAKLSHYAFYVLMIGMPLLGWGMLSAASFPVVLFGGARLPAILPQNDGLHTLLWNAHFHLVPCVRVLCGLICCMSQRRSSMRSPEVTA
jgi:cytochrome b561